MTIPDPPAWPGRRLLALLLLWLPALAQGHSTSTSFLTLDLGQAPPVLRWDIALRDLDALLDLDADRNRALTWGEIRGRKEKIAAEALSHLHLYADQRPCGLSAGPLALADHADGTYGVLTLTANCGGARPTWLDYDLLFDLDPGHRALLRQIGGDGGSTLIGPERRSIELAAGGWWTSFAGYWRDGVWHIWIGLDHLLFLLTLLLPAALRRAGTDWQARAGLGETLGEVAAVVTAFTLAHSLTLCLAVLGLIDLSTRLVESAIAATVVLAAANNLHPFLPGPRWAIAFALGLIHGLGFAAVLADLGLPPAQLAAALAGFNLGVESGQLAVVAAFVPAAFLLRHWRPYRTAAVQYGSAAVALIACVWLAERLTGFELTGL